MNVYLKHWVYCIVSLVLFNACQSHDSSFNETLDATKTIQFSTSINQMVTRGTPITATSQLTNMGVSCYHTGYDSWGTTEAIVTSKKQNWEWTQSGSTWSSSETLNWGNGVAIGERFTFFGYTPLPTAANGITVTSNTVGAPSLNYTVPTTIADQPDLMIAMAKDIHPTPGKVNLAYKHALTCLAFKALGDGQTITAVKVKGVSVSGTLNWDSSGNPVWSNLGPKTTSIYSAGLKSPSVTTTTTPTDILSTNGYLMMIPQTLGPDAKLIVTINGVNKEFNLSAQTATTWTAGQQLTYTINTRNEILYDYTNLESSNCYIVNVKADKDLIYRIPIRRVNEFWNAPNNRYGSNDATNVIGENDVWTVGVLWFSNETIYVLIDPHGQSSIRLTKATGIGPDDYFEFKVPKYTQTYEILKGNFVLGLSKGTTAPRLPSTGSNPSGKIGKILWSWHFWVTEYEPYGTPTALQNATNDGQTWAWGVTGGTLHKFQDFSTSSSNNNFTNGISNPWSTKYADKKIMGRILGNTMCYQYGRKDPFPAYTSKMYYDGGTFITYSTTYNNVSGPVSIAQTVYNPLTRYSGTLTTNWCSTTENNIDTSTSFLWNDPNVPTGGDGGKSIFDPSPYGFKLPENGTWSSFFNSSGMISGTTKYESGSLFYTRVADNYTSAAKYTPHTDSSLMGYFWSASPYDTNAGYGWGKNGTTYAASASVPKSNLGCVTCIQE